jgi:heme/copper-type cytochrome/quinol oxidase subunit 2
MAFAIALILLVIGTVVFHVASPWWFTPIASNWGMMDDTVVLTFWVTGAVFVAVNLFMAYAVVRYRHRKGREQRSEYEPENRKLEWWLTILTSVGVAAMLAPGCSCGPSCDGPRDARSRLGQQWTWNTGRPAKTAVARPMRRWVANPRLDKGERVRRHLVSDPEPHRWTSRHGAGRKTCIVHGPVPRGDPVVVKSPHVAHAMAAYVLCEGSAASGTFDARPRSGRFADDIARLAKQPTRSSKRVPHPMPWPARAPLRPAPPATARTARATRR